MIRKHNLWKALTAAITTLVAVIFSAGSSRALTHRAQAPLTQTLEDRVARIREELESRQVRPSVDPQASSSELAPSKGERSKELYSQGDTSPWKNWNNWDKWSDWSDWNDAPAPTDDWSDWSDAPAPTDPDWSDWNNWSDWSDWSDWNNGGERGE